MIQNTASQDYCGAVFFISMDKLSDEDIGYDGLSVFEVARAIESSSWALQRLFMDAADESCCR